tara:strand:- start:408 stop:686 length:279 start_codon:yes stop_codon:yes gene_type:complete
MNKSLWVDNKTPEDIEYFSKEDSDNVVYNLQEDISCLKETIAELEKELKETREICDAVAHVGVDFGYGVYVLEDSVIHRARLILEALKEQGE